MGDYISVALYGDGSRNAHLRAEYIYCDRCNECSAYKEGKCFRVTYGLAPSRCPVGHTTCVDGGTKASKKFSDLRAKVWADPKKNALSYPTYTYIARVGNDVLLRIPYISIKVEDNRLKIDNPSMFDNDIARAVSEALAPDAIYKLVTFLPRTVFGYDIIKEYQAKTVPNLVRQIRELFPEEFERFVEKYPDYIIPEVDYVGRRAKLITCNRDGEYKADSGVFHFEGEYIASDKYSSSFLPFMGLDRTPVEIKIKLNDKMVVKITSNDQVLPDTEFVD